MMYICLFSATKPSKNFPDSGFRLKLEGDKFDLPLPTTVGDDLYDVIKANGHGLRAVEIQHCKPHLYFFKQDLPARLEKPSGPVNYREFVYRAQHCSDHNDQPTGFIANRIAVTGASITTLIDWLRAGKHFSAVTREHLLKREKYLAECGGFELLRTVYFFDATEEREAFSLFLNSKKTRLHETSKTTRFSEWATCFSQHQIS